MLAMMSEFGRLVRRIMRIFDEQFDNDLLQAPGLIYSQKLSSKMRFHITWDMHHALVRAEKCVIRKVIQ